MGLLSVVPLFFCLLAISSVCGQNSLSEADRQELLDAHNRFRSMVDPPATNMRRMQWNDELAMVAQNYTEMCTFARNPQRADQAPSFATVGENLFVTFLQDVNYTAFVQAWYNQNENYNFQFNNCSAACDEYRQVVWANSDMLGCGVTRCDIVNRFPVPNSLLLVCNYGPAGNIDGERPYMSGTPCSDCPSNMTICVEDLCSTEPPTVTATTLTVGTTLSTQTNPIPPIFTTPSASMSTTSPSTASPPPTTEAIVTEPESESSRTRTRSRTRSRTTRRSRGQTRTRGQTRGRTGGSRTQGTRGRTRTENTRSTRRTRGTRRSHGRRKANL